jgi:hypothetical protein
MVLLLIDSLIQVIIFFLLDKLCFNKYDINIIIKMNINYMIR